MSELLGHGTHAVEFLQTLGLSAHYLIEPDGQVTECVDPDLQAYHAGISKFGDEEGLNKNFVGIEVLVEGLHTYSEFLEAIKKPESFTMEQYDSTAVQCALLMQKYPDITIDHIVRHSDVSGKEIRPNDPKHDVGKGFNWDYFKDLVEVFDHQLKSASVDPSL